jgi:hypothetical protein
MNDILTALPFLTAFVTGLGGLAVGLVALRKAGAEAKKTSADTGGVLIDSAGDVVKMLREQMAAQQVQITDNTARVQSLEVTVGSWESWAERVLTLLDRAVGMLEEEQRARLVSDVAEVKRTRPVRTNPKHEKQGERS